MIRVQNLTKWYGRTLALDDVSFGVEPGSIVGLLGPNGAGKSTVMKILSCYVPATSGQVTVADRDVVRDSLGVRRSLGYMPESAGVYPEMRVQEYLLFRAALRGVRHRRRVRELARVCRLCGLHRPEDVLRRRLGDLSRGYCQRVALAEVLLHDPPVLLLDEPTTGLDPTQIRQMRQVIRQLGQDRTVLLSSHLLGEVEQLCDRLIILTGGRIVATGTPEELREKVVGPARVVAELRTGPMDQIIPTIRQRLEVRELESAIREGWMHLVLPDARDGLLSLRLHRLAAEMHWDLRELRREVGSLEDYFVQITHRQHVVQPPAGGGGR